MNTGEAMLPELAHGAEGNLNYHVIQSVHVKFILAACISVRKLS